MAPYSNAIPQPNDQLDDSQLDILNNFIAIQALVEKNHIGFNLAAESGKHKEVTLPINAAPSVPIAGEVNLWSALNATTGRNELNFQRGPAGNITPITAGSVNPFPQVRNGFTYLPSNLLIKWGVDTIVAANTATVIPYPLLINGIIPPVYQFVYSVFTQPINPDSTQPVISIFAAPPLSTIDFTVKSDDGDGFTTFPYDFFYVALGTGV